MNDVCWVVCSMLCCVPYCTPEVLLCAMLCTTLCYNQCHVMLCTMMYVLCCVVYHVICYTVCSMPCSILSRMPCWQPRGSESVKSWIVPFWSTGWLHPNTTLGILETDTLISNYLVGMWKRHRLPRWLWKVASQITCVSIMVKPDGVVLKQQQQQQKTHEHKQTKTTESHKPETKSHCEANKLHWLWKKLFGIVEGEETYFNISTRNNWIFVSK